MNDTLLELSYTLADIDKAAIKFWELLHDYRIFAFSGEMGAGKTTFIHHLCDHLEVEDAVSSPTFALINEYHFDDHGRDRMIYHLDWYRLRDAAEAINAGMEDCIVQAKNGAAYCFIEWPEKAIELLQTPYLWISIENMSMTERKMTVKLMA
jgi:tRNA threonylcarbamoyladenosine biosynthesis protein TsaE